MTIIIIFGTGNHGDDRNVDTMTVMYIWVQSIARGDYTELTPVTKAS